MATKTIQIGRLNFREDLAVANEIDSQGLRSIKIEGQESIPRLTAADVQARVDDVAGLQNSVVPMLFTTKTYLDGFYRIIDLSSEIVDWDTGLATLAWSLTAVRLGTAQEVDLESRLSGATTRSNAFSAVGERSHAPAIGHTAYWSNGTASSAVVRATTDGNITLYRGLPVTINPRWAINPADYGKGRVRFLDGAGKERIGITFAPNPNVWELNNGLVRVRPLPSAGVLEVSAWTGGAWKPKSWDIQTGGGPTTIGPPTHVRLIRNDYQGITLRLLKGLAPGRMTIDVTLRRGSRLVELYLQHEQATTLKVVLTPAESSTNTSGYVVRTANDADGNKAIIGSAQAFTADITNGGISKAATTTLDAFVGVVAAGSGAVAGDAAADLYAQYLGMPAESVQGVKR